MVLLLRSEWVKTDDPRTPMRLRYRHFTRGDSSGRNMQHLNP